MILNEHVRQEGEPSALSRYLVDEVLPLCRDADYHRAEIEEITEGVLHYCSNNSITRGLRKDYLALLVSRALWSAGREESASVYLEHWFPGDGAHALPHLLSSQADFRPPVLEVFGAGMVYRACWVSERSENSWVLDSRKMQLGPVGMLEIVQTQALRAIVNCIAPIWDHTSGEGCFALRGIAACRCRGGGHSARARYRPEQPLADFCLYLLQRTGRARGWASTPMVLLANV